LALDTATAPLPAGRERDRRRRANLPPGPGRWPGHTPNSIRLDTLDPGLRRVILALRAAWDQADPAEIAAAEAAVYTAAASARRTA